MKVDVAGVSIDNISKQEAIAQIQNLIVSKETGYVVTPYSELVVFALKNPEYRQVLNQAYLALADGVGILWAAKYLSIRATNSTQAFIQLVYTLAAIVLKPKYIRSVISERITGSRLIYDVARLASENNYSLSLVGGQGNVAGQTADKLKTIYPSLKVNLALSGFKSFDEQVAKRIADANSDILLIAYSPPKQEIWLAQNLGNLKCKIAIGLGGTFDYVSGKALVAPSFARSLGLEWLWRLITQPWRLKRMWNALPVFIWKIYMHKINHARN